jgi:hypothetical protein
MAVDQLRRQVRQAQRRLGVERFLRALGYSLAATLLAALLLIVAGKLRWLSVADWIWGAAALGLALLGAALWTMATGHRALGAAMEIDRRFGLKERVSTALAMDARQRESPAGEAVALDAAGRVGRIDLAAQFSIAPGRPMLLPILPALAALAVAVLVPPRAADTPAAAADAAAIAQVQKSSDALQRRLAERRKLAERQGLEEARELLRNLEEKSKSIESGRVDRKDALVKLKDLTEQLQARRDRLHAADPMVQHLNQLKTGTAGPAEKFAQAVSRGNFRQAMEELKALKDQLSGNKLDPQQREQLARQMNEMQHKLQEMTQAQQQALADLQGQMSRLRQSGQGAAADKLQQALDKLLQQAPHMQQAADLAQKLGQCAKCLGEGQLADAAAVLEDLKGRLGAVEKEAEELALLDDALDQIAQARNQMNCSHCGGAGCKECLGDGMGDQLGKGRAYGYRPEQKSNTSSYDSQVRQKVGRGSSSLAGWVDGPNVKGNAQERIKEQAEAVRHAAVDPLTDQQMPREHRQHAQEYFDRVRTGR